MAQIQLTNEELVELLSPYFQKRNEPNFALGNIMSLYMTLPGLRGFWPCSSVNANGHLIDRSGQSRSLFPNIGSELFDYIDSMPFAPLVNLAGLGTGECFVRTDETGLDIIGDEAYVDSDFQGLTMGAWVYPKAYITEDRFILGKWNAGAGDRSYAVQVTAAGLANFSIYSAVPALHSVTAAVALDLNRWHYIVGRWNTSAEMKLWWNRDTFTNIAAIPAVLNNSLAPLVAGARGDFTNGEWDGYESMLFLCVGWVSDAHINSIYQYTKSAYGVTD